MAVISNLRISPNNFAQLVDAGGSAFVADSPADDNGDASIDVPIGTYALNQGPTPTGPWTPVPGIPTIIVANATDAAGNLTPAGAVFPASGSGAQKTTGFLAGTGAPNNAWGQNGWLYFQGDGAVGNRFWIKAAGVWAAFA